MQNITEYLQQVDHTLTFHNEGEWSNTISEYSAFNSGGVECEVGEFLYSLIRMMKPSNVLETGTHMGVGASYMGMALKHNFKGHLDTYEYLDTIYNTAVLRMKIMDLEKYVTCHFGDVSELKLDKQYQLILLDTEPQTRFAEFMKFYPNLDEGGIIFIHDLGRELQQKEIPNLGFAWPYGPLPEPMKELMKKGEIRPFHFDTPRGLSGFYRVHHLDYSWR